MKINFSTQNNYNRNSQISFEAGMTPQIMQKILCTDVMAISDNLAKKGIQSNFNGNKVVAWCSNKIVEIFEQINKKYTKKLPLPRGIYVDDFEKLAVDGGGDMAGYCSMFQSYLYKNSDEVIDGETILFNNFESKLKGVHQKEKEFYDWNNIDTLSDLMFASKSAPTPHFLYIFLHEFCHVAHEEKMLEHMDGEKLLKTIENVLSEESIQKFSKKYGDLVSKGICSYAKTSPLDAIACDMPQKIVSCLNEDLNVTKNPFKNTPYEFRFPLDKIKNKSQLDKILKNFWNGKFE